MRFDGDVGQCRSGREIHIAQRTPDAVAPPQVGDRVRIGDGSENRRHVFGTGSPGHHRLNLIGIDRNLAVEHSIGIGGEHPPAGHAALPGRTLGGVRAVLEIGKGHVVGRDDAVTRPCLDGHVADGQPALHREAADRRAGIFDGMAGRAGGTDRPDDRENQVLGGDTAAEPPGH